MHSYMYVHTYMSFWFKFLLHYSFLRFVHVVTCDCNWFTFVWLPHSYLLVVCCWWTSGLFLCRAVWVLLCQTRAFSALLAEANFPKWLYQFTFLWWCQPWIYNPLCLLFNHSMFGYFLTEWMSVTEVVWFDPWPFLYHCIFIYLRLIVWFELT